MAISTSARSAQLATMVVTAAQMQAIETRIFDAGMPVAALMEKVAGLMAQWLQQQYPTGRVGVLVGPGHNGGDALVVARELHLQGYEVQVYCPFERLKSLTDKHRQYVDSLGLSLQTNLEPLQDCDILVDGLFGFGLTRPLEGTIAASVEAINQWSKPVVSIDLPSGIHTDSGAILGTAIRATHTLCLGLWKRAFFQTPALPYLGEPTLIDFGIPLADIQAVLGTTPQVQRLSPASAIATLPLPRDINAHKYKVGHLLLIAGSRQYAGAARLCGEGAVASGVGMLTMAVPESLRLALINALPGALLVGCPETSTGAIDRLPDELIEKLPQFDAIACGPGLTQAAQSVVETLIQNPSALLLDADGLNIVSKLNPAQTLSKRTAPTVLTPHPGEFRRLFPDLDSSDAGAGAHRAAAHSQSLVILKGARTVVATPSGQIWFNPISTPALARGGSGDVLTGLMGGLLAQKLVGLAPEDRFEAAAAAALGAVWWHSETGCYLHHQRTVLGVDPLTLAQSLNPALQACFNHAKS